ncbi:cysteine-rich VLP domain-containing protein [[Clostridium] leptum]|nr:cysteine-rich VLP domain-containing protein [[Clostridium] leptum]
MNDRPLPRMNYTQYRKMRRLVHECCNYDGGNCILLDDGEGCVCVQSISYSLLCKWFRIAVLPLDKDLAAVLFPARHGLRRCGECGRSFSPPRHNTLYCPECAARRTRRKKREWAARNRGRP